MRKVSRYSYRGHLQIYTRSYFENINSSVLFCHKFYILPVAHPTYRYWDLATLQPAQESRYHIFFWELFPKHKKKHIGGTVEPSVNIYREILGFKNFKKIQIRFLQPKKLQQRYDSSGQQFRCLRRSCLSKYEHTAAKKKVEAIQPLQKKRFEKCLNQLKCQQRRELMGELPDLKSCNIFGWCVRFGEVFSQKMHPEFCQVTRKFG